MMSIDRNKNETDKIQQFQFFRSFYEAGEWLENDTERGVFYRGILKYAFSNGSIIPDFSQNKMMQMGWTMIQYSVDKSLHKRRPGNTNAKKDENANKTQTKRKQNAKPVYDIDKDIDIDIDKKESSKETAEPFSLTTESEKMIPFTRWTEQQFREDIARFPEYAEFQQEFTAYWTQPTPNGKMLFQKERAWETGCRLNTWKRKHDEKTPFRTTPEQIDKPELPEVF